MPTGIKGITSTTGTIIGAVPVIGVDMITHGIATAARGWQVDVACRNQKYRSCTG